ALAVDEVRSFFVPTSWGGIDGEEEPGTPGQDVQEAWFPGSHSDVGGGYAQGIGIARASLDWVADAVRDGRLLFVDQAKSSAEQAELPDDYVRHPSLVWFWRL